MKRSVSLFILFFLFNVFFSFSQEKFRVMFYNVENLYDTFDNPNTNDDDLTTTGNLHWSGQRYWNKINNISKVIYAVGENYPPALIGLCEVENKLVLQQLTAETSLRKDKYEFVISDSKDRRGSNVALLYQRDQIKVINVKSYTPVIDSVKTTRDILHVTGRVVNGDLLDVFVCHFPSRIGGIKKTTPYRKACNALLRAKIDSLFKVRKKANLVIMGDFNDYPDVDNLYSILAAKEVNDSVSPQKLYNLFYTEEKMKSSGTYKHRGKWNYVDQFITNGRLLNKTNKISILENKAFVFIAPFLMENDKKYGEQKPFRTYSGWKYLGGYSDHLPIYIDLIIR